ncbi:hypothetical protein [Natrinema salinisoli]|uniref:hypothetical protein n=1 Tax=Natrinema salinisoli TaxID=2878535 RepID=UPI001CF06318|nr:hypothetical protein [Natrinema salinisoli]
MTRSRLTRLLECRRLLPLVAAVLFVLALRVPVWRITLTAPQYVDALVVELYAHPRIGGDWQEVRGLNKYVGFYYPDPVYAEPNYEPHEKAIDVPEWVLGPVVFLGMGAASAVVSLLPSRRISRGLSALFASSIAIFGAMGAIIQYRLYQAGHSLDPDAPLNGVDGFTPPLLGSYEVANISGTAWFGPGGYMLVGAVALLGVAVVFRDSTATVGDLPGLLRNGWERGRNRIRRRDSDDGSRQRTRDDGSDPAVETTDESTTVGEPADEPTPTGEPTDEPTVSDRSRPSPEGDPR